MSPSSLVTFHMVVLYPKVMGLKEVKCYSKEFPHLFPSAAFYFLDCSLCKYHMILPWWYNLNFLGSPVWGSLLQTEKRKVSQGLQPALVREITFYYFMSLHAWIINGSLSKEPQDLGWALVLYWAMEITWGQDIHKFSLFPGLIVNNRAYELLKKSIRLSTILTLWLRNLQYKILEITSY